MRYKKKILTSISRDFWIIITATIVCVASLSFGFNFVVYNSYIDERTKSLPAEASKIEYVLIDSIQYIDNYANFIGQRISEHGASDLEYIANLLGGKENIKPNPQNLFISTLFDWVTPDKKMVVTSNVGVLDKPIDMSHREYLNYTPKSPWTLQVQDPAVGIPSGQWIIPGGVGVTDSKGKFLGSVTLGFAIDGLAKKINSAIGNDLNFIIITEDFKYVGSTFGSKESDDSKYFLDQNLIHTKSLLNAQEGFLKDAIKLGNNIYPYYKKTSKYGYIILVGYSNSLPANILNEILLPRIIEFLMLGTIIISLLLLVKNRIVEPLVQLSALVTNISKREKTPSTLLKSNIIEIRNLSRAIMQMRRAFIREESLKKRLRQAYKSAESANIAKTEFLSATAHELRSPLNAIIGMSEVIKTKMFGDEADNYTEYAGDIEQSGHELLEFITDLIDVSKSETGSFALDNQEVLDVQNIINRSIKLNINRANKAHIQIKTHIDENLPKLYADSRRLRQMLVNLLSNSIKYSASDTMINISAIEKDGRMIISVADQGFGMNKEQVKIALKKWGQVENQNTGKVDSSGLGLPLAHHLAKLHNADFLIDSEPGKGTTVSIVFPEDRVRK